jgi:serine/threonine-protein kinase
MTPQASNMEMFQPGQILAGKYKVEQLIGSGGMGYVILAEHLLLRRRVALKMLRPVQNAASNNERLARFLREAQAVAQLQSEHVVAVLDMGQLPDSTISFLVMEFLDGQDLEALLRKRGRLPPSEVADYMIQACDAIAEAHSKGIVHRDLKPSNIFLSRRKDGTPLIKVLDFGISKVSTVGDQHMSLTGEVGAMGTPFYMPREQFVSAKKVDHRADIWALGAMIYHLVSGHVPFWGETKEQVLEAVLTTAPSSLRALDPNIPEAFESLVFRCLDKNISGRFSSVQELVQQLAPFAPPRARELAVAIQKQGKPQTDPGEVGVAASGAGARATPGTEEEVTLFMPREEAIRRPGAGGTVGIPARSGPVPQLPTAQPVPTVASHPLPLSDKVHPPTKKHLEAPPNQVPRTWDADVDPYSAPPGHLPPSEALPAPAPGQADRRHWPGQLPPLEPLLTPAQDADPAGEARQLSTSLGGIITMPMPGPPTAEVGSVREAPRRQTGPLLAAGVLVLLGVASGVWATSRTTTPQDSAPPRLASAEASAASPSAAVSISPPSSSISPAPGSSDQTVSIDNLPADPHSPPSRSKTPARAPAATSSPRPPATASPQTPRNNTQGLPDDRLQNVAPAREPSPPVCPPRQGRRGQHKSSREHISAGEGSDEGRQVRRGLCQAGGKPSAGSKLRDASLAG